METMINSEITTFTLQKYASTKKEATRLRYKLHSTRSILRPVTYVIYRFGKFHTITSQIEHWTLSDVWDRVDEVFSKSKTNSKINLSDWGLIAKIVIYELKERVRHDRS